MVPGLGARRKEIHCRLEASWIVEAACRDQHELRKAGRLAKDSAAAGGTESAAESIAAIGAALVVFYFAGDLHGIGRNCERGHISATRGFLAITAMAISAEHWRG